jgi:hypothetical protein
LLVGGGMRISYDQIGRYLHQAGQAQGLRVAAHDLRRYFCNRLLALGVSVPDIANLVLHYSAHTTIGYIGIFHLLQREQLLRTPNALIEESGAVHVPLSATAIMASVDPDSLAAGVAKALGAHVYRRPGRKTHYTSLDDAVHLLTVMVLSALDDADVL